MISRRQGGGDEAYFTYVEEADDEANKDSALIGNWNYIKFSGSTSTVIFTARVERFCIISCAI
jgi:hypothetical protein